MISIKHRYTGTTLCEFDVGSIKECAEQGKADLYGANLRGADLRGANLHGANLYGANLYGANLRGANLHGANLYGANLYGANLYGADLRGADLRGADLHGADLRGADLYGANLHEANLYGATLDGEVLNKNPIQISCGLKYAALITEGYMRLGCKRFTHDEWAAFSNRAISAMDIGALEFWKQWKETLLAMCKAHRGSEE